MTLDFYGLICVIEFIEFVVFVVFKFLNPSIRRVLVFTLATCNPGPDLLYKLIALIRWLRPGLYASQDHSTPSHQGGL